jgi:hypothetical protein
MTGIEHFNFPAFDAAAAQLREAGHEVFNPADNDRLNGFEGIGTSGDPVESAFMGFSLRNALKQDLSWICDHAEGLALLPGWHVSKGAKAELALAKALQIPFKPVDDWIFDPIPIPAGGISIG